MPQSCSERTMITHGTDTHKINELTQIKWANKNIKNKQIRFIQDVYSVAESE